MASTWKRPSSVRSFRGDWKDIDWAVAYRECKEQQDLAVNDLLVVHEQRRAAVLRKREQEHEMVNPEAGAYEGNVSDEVDIGEVSRAKIFKTKLNASNKVMESFIETNHIKHFGIPMMAELLKHISSYSLKTVGKYSYDPKLLQREVDRYGRIVAAEGHISAAELYRSIFTDDTMMGVYQFLMMDSRSCYLEKQYLSPAKSYCSLVPLIMYAFKFYKNVPYSHWHFDQIHGITNPKLSDAMMFTPEEPFSTEEIIAAREEGLSIKSGRDKGGSRNPTYTFKLYGASAFKGVPELAQVMYSQIWCAHPNNRTKYMVLDPINWDNVPPPLMTQDVLAAEPVPKVIYSQVIDPNSPW